MKYMGSKARFAHEIIPFLMNGHDQTKPYVEPFAGGMNMIDKVPAEIRFANDTHAPLIAMWDAIVDKGWNPPQRVTREFYAECRAGHHPNHVAGYVGFNCSYSGKWFGGYAGVVNTRQGIRDYQAEAYRNVMKQAAALSGVMFLNVDYWNLDIEDGATVYCDPPYAGTTGYANDFDHKKFWNWVRDISKRCRVFVSEYTAPDDFVCVWEKIAKSSLSANGKAGGNKESTERLFVHGEGSDDGED